MLTNQASLDLLKSIVNLNYKHGYHCDDYFRWMVDDALADLGVKKKDPPPKEVMPELFNLGKQYGNAIINSEPFTDILGFIYMELAGKYKQKSLGQYFTPWPVALMMAEMMYSNNSEIDKDKLFSVYDPACGSGIMLLAFAYNVVKEHDTSALRYFSFNGIDLDSLCARITACQFLANAVIHRLTFGEILIYRGNALGSLDGLDVVIHSTRSDLPESLFIPAKAKCREATIQEATKKSQKIKQTGFDF